MLGRDKSNVIIAIELFCLGIILIYSYWSRTTIDLSAAWPLIFILLGLPLIAQYSGNKNTKESHHLFLGFNLIGAGLFFAIFSLSVWNLTFQDVILYWPILVFVFGLSLMLVAISDVDYYSGLVSLANWLLSASVLAFIVSYAIFESRRVLMFLRLWPLILLPVLLLLLGFFVPVREDADDTQ